MHVGWGAVGCFWSVALRADCVTGGEGGCGNCPTVDRLEDAGLCVATAGVRGDLDLLVGVVPRLVADISNARSGVTTWKPLVAVACSPRPRALKGNPAVVVQVLNAGADDCLSCPFDPAELRARLCAVARRGHLGERGPDVVEVDRNESRVRIGNFEARLSRRQLDVFSYLAERRERWVHSSEIIKAVCGTHHDEGTLLVRVQIHGIRRAVGPMRICVEADGHRSYRFTSCAASLGTGDCHGAEALARPVVPGVVDTRPAGPAVLNRRAARDPLVRRTR